MVGGKKALMASLHSTWGWGGIYCRGFFVFTGTSRERDGGGLGAVGMCRMKNGRHASSGMSINHGDVGWKWAGRHLILGCY